jgi:hypothetical protein
MRSVRLASAALALAALAMPATGWARPPWPPATGPGHLFVHFGEEHWNDADGLTLLPKVVTDSVRYRPDLVTMSGDKDNDGTIEQLTKWREIMSAYDRAGIPYFASVGNHDRKAPPGVPPGVSPAADLSNYERVFASRPYPFGDARPYRNALLSPRSRPADDPPGAASHYYVDSGRVRWIFIDNSCWGIVNCDPLQNPAEGGDDSQYDFLERRAGEASRQGKLVFVVMHMPTRDPRDQSYADPTSVNHTMGKGTSPDNMEFEDRIDRLGVDGVFVAHIKGQFLYRGRGGVPYYIDGGAGGELYTTGPVGVDHGYWHGYRLVRAAGRRITTDSVPIFVRNGITIRGPSRLGPGRVTRFEAFGRQPVFNDPAKVPALELRDPDPVPKQSALSLAAILRQGAAFFAPPLLLLLLGLLRTVQRRRLALAAPALAGLALAGLAAVALAQRSEPTSTPKDALPNPARIWTTANRFVLAPVPSASEDRRRDPGTQTHDGAFRARCPGNTRIVIRSGFESRSASVRVPSRPGRIVRSLRVARGARRAGVRRRVARLRLAQPAEVMVRIRRRGRTLRTLRRGCYSSNRRLSFSWDGRLRRHGKLRRARRGRYRVEIRVRSDRPVFRRSRLIRLR